LPFSIAEVRESLFGFLFLRLSRFRRRRVVLLLILSVAQAREDVWDSLLQPPIHIVATSEVEKRVEVPVMIEQAGYLRLELRL
jgi:hypothetical protein